MALNKKAVLFSLISVLVSGFIILLFWNINSPRLDSLSNAVDARVSVMDRYLASWDAYVGDATRLSVRQALAGLTERIETYHPSHDNLPFSEEVIVSNLTRCLRTGSAPFLIGSGSGSDSFCFAGVDASLDAKLNNFTSLAQQALGFTTSYIYDTNITVTDWDPFRLQVSFTINSTITDPVFAVWNRSKHYDIIVSVDGLPDPLFEYYAPTFISVAAHRNLTQFSVPRTTFNFSAFKAFVSNESYVAQTGRAPTYLQRLRGLTDNNTETFDPLNRSGIETIIFPPSISIIIPARYENTSWTAHQLFAGMHFSFCNASDGTFAINNMTNGVNDTLTLDLVTLFSYRLNTSDINFTYARCEPP